MTERKLASIQKIAEVAPIENADAIEKVRVNGWWIVTKRGEFSVGDLCVFFEVDSVLPIAPQYEFLRKSCYVSKDWLPNKEGFRLKTVRLRKQISQGLVVPVTVLETTDYDITRYSEGIDVTELLGVTKWEPPVAACLSGVARGNFPSFIRKTDQERVQNLVREVFSEPNDSAIWEVTVKLDGSSCTIFSKDGELGVCSRNLELSMSQDGNSFVDAAKETFIIDGENILVKNGLDNLALQFELMGPGIQKNREGLTKNQLFLYDIWDIENQCYVTPSVRKLICEKLNLTHVPILHSEASFANLHINDLDDLLEFTEGPSLVNPVREGTVWKREDGEYSFKVISNKYLEKEE